MQPQRQDPPRQIRIDSDLILRPLFSLDAQVVYQCIAGTRANLSQFLAHWDLDLAGLEARLDQLRDQWGGPGEQAYAILEHGHFVGVLSLSRLEAKNRAAELGYWLAQQAQGRGVMTRVAEAGLALLFDHFNANQIIITSYAANTKSRAVAQRLGFRLDGITRQWRINQQGQLCDKATYSLLRNEWKEQRDRPENGPRPLPDV